MYTVGHVFGEIIGAWCGRGEPARLGVDVPATSDLLEVALARCMAVGLDVQPAPSDPVRHLIVTEGDGTRTLERRSVYGLCSLDSVQAAMLAVIDHVRAREGAGRIWFCGRPSYLHRHSENTHGLVATRIEGREEDDAFGVPHFIPTGDGTRRVLIGAYYFHAPEASAENVINAALAELDKHTHSAAKPIDPLDVKYDGVPLRGLLQVDDDRMRERSKTPLMRTPAQHAAISAHWSAQLRAKVAASTAAEVQRERGRIACDPREPLDLED